ncbi:MULTISPECIES: winged helix-turn-helix transcriptional regulator [unclassified Variovorax]|uniref:winged helix-turn-helix transcriptional regulator n=1 Tax=Variovorax sp. efr-133-TYG-130 TaxID=3040327 RepID=UPI001F392300|nr:winged helix-turn-helix transcriptional regulator [Variovorax sp. PMC12]
MPPRVDYALTPLGRSLADAVVALCTWGNRERGRTGKHLRRASYLVLTASKPNDS